jgi:cation diffusion facilitator family transporter
VARPAVSEERVRFVSALAALVIGAVVLAVKLYTWRITGSSAVLSDALEGIVNVVAAIFAIGGVIWAGRPADRGHPYGHGKIEFFTAAFEGGLISFAAVLVFVESVRAFLHGPSLQQIDLGLLLLVATSLVNGMLGWSLIHIGRKFRSLALEADGRHVFSDFLTGVGVALGLLLVRLTGQLWLDPLVAALVGLSLIGTGWRLVRRAAGGLLDEEDTSLLAALVEAAEKTVGTGIIRIHNLRVIRAGRFHHVDAHLVVPEFWDVNRAHAAADAFEQRLFHTMGLEGEIVFHTDPCQRLFCSACDLADCPIRRRPYHHRPSLTVEEAVHPDPPLHFEI